MATPSSLARASARGKQLVRDNGDVWEAFASKIAGLAFSEKFKIMTDAMKIAEPTLQALQAQRPNL